MNDRPSFTQCSAYLEAHARAAAAREAKRAKVRLPFVTISRQMGAGAVALGGELTDWLQTHDQSADAPWTLFERNLMEMALAEHHLPANLAAYLPEGRVSEIQSAIRELFGLHPPLATMFQHMTQTVLGLAEMGRVVLVGRGACLITRHLDQGFHVRLVGSSERRLARVMQSFKLSRKEATAFLRKGETARKAFVKKFFGTDLADPMYYHLVVNTDRMTMSEAARLIGAAVLARAPHA
ncbi:MAG: cytidylate kinase-like family protein [Verrucomicrobiae bacterium]|nr:cytidylate kinase-like family protein [Verrucomicrobiae bacterium]